MIAGLTSGQLLQAQVVGYNEDGLPQVNLYLILGPQVCIFIFKLNLTIKSVTNDFFFCLQQVILLNHELVVRGLAERFEQEF